MDVCGANDAAAAAMDGYFVPDDEQAEVAQGEDTAGETQLFGDCDKMSPSQRASVLELKECGTYPRVKVKRIALSFSGASVYFFSPIRKDGSPMPSSVVKLDTAECVQDEAKKTHRYARLFGLTTPRVKDLYMPSDESKPDDPDAVMQIDLCGGVFGLPEFASAPAVLTFASVLESELKAAQNTVDIPPIINEALERRMRSFTMSNRSVKKTDLPTMYKISRFVGHGILNRAAEGAKRAKKSPAIAAGFLTPATVQELDPDGNFMQELVGHRQTVESFFTGFLTHEPRFKERFEREVVRGVCHNDLHGGNLLLDSQGLVWLIDFATVKEDVHVLMDLSKFLASCLFLYCHENVDEDMMRTAAKVLATTPDATTAFPAEGCQSLAKNGCEGLMLELLTRLRHCICSYEVGDDAPSNDGIPFATAFFSWSARMLSYNEPTLHQKTRALYFALAFAQRLMYEAGIPVGKVASKWINDFRFQWEGEKQRRLSTSATQLQQVTHNFDVEFPRYLAHVGTTESWSTDFLSRERVHVMDHCITITLTHSTAVPTRLLFVSELGKAFIGKLEPVLKRLVPALVETERFYGRVLIVGDSGTGKSTLTKQLFSEVCSGQVQDLYAKPGDLPGLSAGALPVDMVPVRVPLIDLARQLESDPDIPVTADALNDMLALWVEKKYGMDSAPHKIVLEARTSAPHGAPAGRRASTHSAASQRSQRSSTSSGSQELPSRASMKCMLYLLDGLDEAAAAVPVLLEYFTSLLETEPDNPTLVTSRPSVLRKDILQKFGDLSFVSLYVTLLDETQAAEIAVKTLERLGESREVIDNMLRDISDPGYKSLTQIPLVLTLLLHVLRKFKTSQADAADVQKQVLSKTDVYQRAMRLLLHQSDAAKFQMRDGKSDQAMVRNFEMLKSVRARKFLQTISWQAHTLKQRVMTWDDLHRIGKDEELTRVLQKLFEEGRLPIFEKVESTTEESQVQLTHLSFQELLAGEYAAAIARQSHHKGSMRPYLNYVLSSSVLNIDRDRLGEAWWMHVWLHVFEMLPPTEHEELCNVLCEDERAKLGSGSVVNLVHWAVDYASQLAQVVSMNTRPEKKCTTEIVLTSIDEGTGLCRWKSGKVCCMRLAPEVDLPVHIDSCAYRCDGVGGLLRHASRLEHAGCVEALLRKGLRPTCHDDEFLPAWEYAMRSASKGIFRTFEQCGLVPGTYTGPALSCNTTMKTYVSSIEGAREIFGVAVKELRRASYDYGLLQQAYAGTLAATSDTDPNHHDPKTGVSMLMLAAAGGHHDIVEDLLRRRALVNQRSGEGCTALNYATECAKGAKALLCMESLIAARAEVNHVAGVTARNCRQRHFGAGLPLGLAACQSGEMDKYDVLVRAGHAVNLGSETGRLPVHALGEASNPTGEMLKEFRRLREEMGAGEPGSRGLAQLPKNWLWAQTIHSYMVPHLDLDMQVLYYGAPGAEAVGLMLDLMSDVHHTVDVYYPTKISLANTLSLGFFEILYVCNPRHQQGDLSSLNQLLEHKWTLRPESRKKTAVRCDFLLLSTDYAAPACMEWLLEQGADLTEPNMFITFKDYVQMAQKLFPHQYAVYTDFLLKQELKQAQEAEFDRPDDAVAV